MYRSIGYSSTTCTHNLCSKNLKLTAYSLQLTAYSLQLTVHSCVPVCTGNLLYILQELKIVCVQYTFHIRAYRNIIYSFYMFYGRIYTSPTSYTRACAYIWYHIPPFTHALGLFFIIKLQYNHRETMRVHVFTEWTTDLNASLLSNQNVLF